MGGLVEQNTPFYTVKTIVSKLLKIDECKNIHEREELLLEHITDFNMRQLLPLLNDLLILKVCDEPVSSNVKFSSLPLHSSHKLTPPQTWWIIGREVKDFISCSRT